MEAFVTIRFMAQNPLGKLARWLRLLGFDTWFEGQTQKAFMKEGALETDRILLTRSAKTAGIPGGFRSIVIRSDSVQDQLRQVFQEMRFTREALHPFSRCSKCNASTERLDKDHVAGRVPEYVWAMHEVFSECRVCHRIYWPGTHTERAEREIDALFKAPPIPDRTGAPE